MLSIYKIALHVEPEDIVPVGLTHANMQKLKKVLHNILLCWCHTMTHTATELGQRMGISRSLKWSVLSSCAYTAVWPKV